MTIDEVRPAYWKASFARGDLRSMMDADPTLHVVLFQPQIPPNTGNVGRTCAFARVRLHLVHPLGFSLADRWLRRSGMDYWQHVDVHQHQDWATMRASSSGPRRLWLMTRFAGKCLYQAQFAEGDGLVFGSESSGVPAWLRQTFSADSSLCLPSANSALRSLNLATAVGITTYEALRQLRWASPSGRGEDCHRHQSE